MSEPFGPLVTVDWLGSHLGGRDLVVVDCRFTLTDPAAGRRGWLEGHVPGAAFLDLGRDLSGALRDGGATGGRHPLPDARAFEASARRAGIDKDSRVVAYDEAGEGGAARLWWLLRHFGHDAVAVLDGGLREWCRRASPLQAGTEQPLAPGGFTARARHGDTVTAEELQAEAPRLLDARARERFRGDAEPMDPMAGHIPGAHNVPFAELAPDGRLPSPAELRERLGETPFVAYCGSGVTASTLLLAAEAAGIEARLYPGSWSEWSRRGLPVEREAH